jgi:3-phosphoshikimate 1-carboxyvinyltransferase
LAQAMSVLRIAPRSRPVEAVVRPPGSKSLTNRALVVASLARGGVSKLWDPLEAEDTQVMRRALRAFGVMIDDVDDPWLVLGTGGELSLPSTVVDVGASGTTARFLTALSALVPGRVALDGTRRMRERPIAELAEALTSLGAAVDTSGGFPPVVVEGTVRGGRVVVDASRSSQFLSALLMIGPMLPEGLEVIPRGKVVSRPYVVSTIEVMEGFGAQVEEGGDGWRVRPGGYLNASYEIEADASAAVYPLVAAALVGGVVAVDGIPEGSTQADLAALEVLAAMGCTVQHSGNRILLQAPSGRLQPVDVDMGDAPDAVLALSVACLFADGESRMRNVGNLRLKETDRLSALETELRRIGGRARVEGDDLVVGPGRLTGARVETYDDHRMAMSFALAGLVVDGIEISDPDCVAKTWPGFFDMLEKL